MPKISRETLLLTKNKYEKSTTERTAINVDRGINNGNGIIWDYKTMVTLW
jgi:hypothetical protein